MKRKINIGILRYATVKLSRIHFSYSKTSLISTANKLIRKMTKYNEVPYHGFQCFHIILKTKKAFF